MRICSKCKTEKPENEFARDGRKKSGFSSHCLACVGQKNAAYLRANAGREYIPVPEEKHCTQCDLTKPSSEFGKDRTRPDGLLSACKLCARARRQRYLYKASPEEIAAMLVAQNGLCAICGEDFSTKAKGYHVDHCHTGGGVRGLLCLQCNAGLGMFKDSPDLLRAAIAYL